MKRNLSIVEIAGLCILMTTGYADGSGLSSSRLIGMNTIHHCPQSGFDWEFDQRAFNAMIEGDSEYPQFQSACRNPKDTSPYYHVYDSAMAYTWFITATGNMNLNKGTYDHINVSSDLAQSAIALTLGLGYKFQNNFYLFTEAGYGNSLQNRKFKSPNGQNDKWHMENSFVVSINAGIFNGLPGSWKRKPCLNNSLLYRYSGYQAINKESGKKTTYNSAHFVLGLSSGIAFNLFNQTFLSTNLSFQYMKRPDDWDSRTGWWFDEHFRMVPEVYLIVGLNRKS